MKRSQLARRVFVSLSYAFAEKGFKDLLGFGFAGRLFRRIACRLLRRCGPPLSSSCRFIFDCWWRWWCILYGVGRPRRIGGNMAVAAFRGRCAGGVWRRRGLKRGAAMTWVEEKALAGSQIEFALTRDATPWCCRC